MPLAVFVPAQLNDLSVDVSLGSPAQGAVLYRGASVWNALAAGTSGMVLTTQGAGANPTWTSVSGGMVNPDLILTRGGQSNPADPKYFTITPGADTNLAAGVEANDVLWSLNRTQQFATGALALQRAVRIRPPTYSFAGASTLSEAATLAIDGAPLAGANATITVAEAVRILTGGDPAVGLVIKGNSATQSGNLLQAQDNTGQVNAALSAGGALRCSIDPNAFGAGTYSALVVGQTTGPDAAFGGGLYAVGRAVKSNKPFTALAGFDDSAHFRQLYFGGGGWTVPDANIMTFWTDPAATEQNQGGLLRMQILMSGEINLNGQFAASQSASFSVWSLTASMPTIQARRFSAAQTAALFNATDENIKALWDVSPAGAVDFYRQSSTTAGRLVAVIDAGFLVNTDASRQGFLILSAVDFNATREALRIDANGTVPRIGFLGHTAQARPAAYTITNPVSNRTFDTTTVTTQQLAQVLGTLLADLAGYGLTQ